MFNFMDNRSLKNTGKNKTNILHIVPIWKVREVSFGQHCVIFAFLVVFPVPGSSLSDGHFLVFIISSQSTIFAFQERINCFN